MASISNDPGGRKRLQFVDAQGNRKAIRLGKVTQRAAETIAVRVEQVVSSRITGTAIDGETSRWLAGLDPRLAEKLVKAGLIQPRSDKGVTLKEHLDAYLAKRTDVKPSTLLHWNHTKRSLLAFFGGERQLTTITAGDAKDWERWLKTGDSRSGRYDGRELEDGLAPNTARKRVGNARQFFADAVDRELIIRNPFAGLSATVGSNRERDYFVTPEMAQKVLDACPDNQWRLLFALARYGGLRCPSELLALKWGDVDWANSRIKVHSPKTEHHEGKGSRMVPLFPELRSHLEAVWEEAEPGTEWVVTRYRSVQGNLRTQLERIIGRAGLTPWPKLWQNLRASRATELANKHPAHVAAAWLGHSTLVANKHYWQVTDDDYVKATSEKAAQKTAQQAHETARKEQQRGLAGNEETPVFPGFATGCGLVYKEPVGDTRLEHPHFSSGNTALSNQSGAESGALGALGAPNDPAFVELAASWPSLSEEIRAAIMSLVRGAKS